MLLLLEDLHFDLQFSFPVISSFAFESGYYWAWKNNWQMFLSLLFIYLFFGRVSEEKWRVWFLKCLVETLVKQSELELWLSLWVVCLFVFLITNSIIYMLSIYLWFLLLYESLEIINPNVLPFPRRYYTPLYETGIRTVFLPTPN